MSDHSDTLDTLGIPSLPMFDLIGNDFALFNDLGELPFRPYPVRLSALWFAVCRRGHARLRIDLREVTLEAGQMLIILPDQIMEQVELADGLEGMLMAVSRQFVEGVIPSIERLAPLMMQVRQRPCLPLTPEEMEALGEYHAFLRRKVQLKDSPFRAEITQGLLMALFYEVYAVHLRLQASASSQASATSLVSHESQQLGRQKPSGMEDQGSNVHAGEQPLGSGRLGSDLSTADNGQPQVLLKPRVRRNRSEELFQRFMQLLPRHIRRERSVAYYAGQLCVTAKHLTVAVREVSGRTASQWIEEFVVLEAKVMLRSTDLTIQEISVRLHFANQSFFGKYFHRVAGLSPKEYRQQ